MPLLTVPNFSEGRDPDVIAALRTAIDRQRAVLDRHSDPEHNRTVFTLAGEPRALEAALEAGAEVALERIDMRHHHGLHPCIGAIDVCPLVWLSREGRADAERIALAVGERIAALGIPVFLYGELASSEERRERAFFRDGGLKALGRRMLSGQLSADRGPDVPHPTAGACLVTARPPLAAFNVELDSSNAVVAQRVAAELRQAGGGLPGVRAIGLPLESGRTQVSTNVHDPITVPLREVVEEVRRLAARHGAAPVAAEVVGLVPHAALEGFPEDLPLLSFDPSRHVIERRVVA
jgi:glutamate formiminotransferase/glutamate formiminotransferase/formiminotetrahydrofolate cyclodeaminase